MAHIHNGNSHNKQQKPNQTGVDDEEKSHQKSSMLQWTTRSEHVLHFLASHKASGTLREHKFISKSLNHCKKLFEKDGEVILIDNYGKKEKCDSYPIKIIISKAFIQHNTKLTHKNLSSLFENACYARARRRFVAPVIFLPNHACIARSATLSSSGELLLNKSSTFVANAINYNTDTTTASPLGNDVGILRAADIKLLNHLNIKFVCDLMVEKKKKFGIGGYGMKVASSEKADKLQRYKPFYVNCIPYPGCELFKLFKDREHNASNLMPLWSDPMNDAVLNLDNGSSIFDNLDQKSSIKWTDYRTWDIIQLTQNYLRLIMDYLQISFKRKQASDNIGVLIHCVCGWDRTPLFISLVRLSLWADGIIHCDLTASQILYLTLSYDWLLFTHQFGLRLKKGEHIFQFSFYMLQWIVNEKYSIFYNENSEVKTEAKTNFDAITDESKSESFLEKYKNVSKREERLMEVSQLFDKIYTQVMEINVPPKYAVINGGIEDGMSEITEYFKSMFGGVSDNNGSDHKTLSVYEKLIGMGFGDQIAMKSAKKYPKSVEKALNYALKHQYDEKLEDSHK